MTDILATLSSDFAHLATSAGLFALLNIILIDLVMSGDNAILIGMATKKLSGSERKKAIFWGVAGATILRIIFSLGAVWLMQIPGLEFLGAVLLLYVVWKFYREIRAHEHHEEGSKEANTLSTAIKTIIIADVAMSLDNVLAVAGASHGNIVNLGIGLIISIILMVVASGWIAKMLEKYPSIQWLGLFIILFTALEMLEKGFSKVAEPVIFGVPESSIFTLLLIFVVGGFAFLQTKYLRPDHSAFADWAKRNGKPLMVTIFILLILVTNFGGRITEFMNSHHGYKYGFIMICILGILEILRIENEPEKHGLLRRLFEK
ncbi:MAG: TerC family protein [Candidatus Gracilibacteria bacterium]|nr:TerC family protein [Candidatus Gracilibacteria bacterium]